MNVSRDNVDTYTTIYSNLSFFMHNRVIASCGTRFHSDYVADQLDKHRLLDKVITSHPKKCNGCSCNSVDELINAVAKITTIDRRKVREVVETRFSSEVIIDQYIGLYTKLIKS
jgi:hypothetical protein